MQQSVFVYDPIAHDPQSRVRGVGRYLQILKENFREFVFTADVGQVSADSTFINPFFNFLQPPLVTKRVAARQAAVIHDLIPLKYPHHFPSGLRGKANIFLNKRALRNYGVFITDSKASQNDIEKILGVNKNRVHVVYPCLPTSFTKGDVILGRSKATTPESGAEKADSGQVPRLRSGQARMTRKDSAFPTSYFIYVGDATWNKNLVNLAKAVKMADVSCAFVGAVFTKDRNFHKEEKFGQVTGDVTGRAPDSAQRSEHWREGKSRQDPSPSLLRATFDPSELAHPWKRELKEFLKLAEGDDRFVFPGFVPDAKLKQLYQQALANLLVSHDEGFGFSYLEAASQGTPSLLSDIPVFRELADEAALFADPDDPGDIAEKIRLLLDEEVQKAVASEAKERLKFFSKENFKKTFLDELSHI